MEFTTGTLIPFLIALSFAAGLNLYATIAVLGLLARWQVAPLPAGLEMIGSTWVIVAACALFAVEFFADKIPVFDVVWSAVHTFIRIPAAALIAFKASEHLTPGMQVLVTVLGASIAAVAHGSKTAVRVAANASPEPVSNIALSSAGDVAAVGLTWFATHHPVAAGVTACAALVVCVFAVRWLYRMLRRGVARAKSEVRAVLAPYQKA